MAYQTPEDDRFEEILMMDGVNIQEFHQEDPVDIFPNATYFPQFFEQNLVNPNRVLKQFLNDPQSNIRIFYFQLLRLAFEVPTEMGYNHICLQNFKKIVFHPEFEILFTPDTQSQRDIYNDFQFKKLFAQFISLLITASQSQPPSIEQAIDQFPIMDVVLIHIIRSLIVSFNIKVAFDEKIQTDLLFKQLSSVLQLSLTSYGNCWKFEQSDMFCFQQNEEEIYVAFIADQEYADDDQNLQTIQSIQNQQRSQQNDERSSNDVNLINSTSDKNNHPRQRSDQYAPKEYITPEYVVFDQQEDDGRKWSNELYSNQTFGDVNGRYSEPQPSVITSIPDNRYRGQSLNNQPTVISHYGVNGENSRIEEMFSKIDSTLNNIHGGSRATQQIPGRNEIGPLSRAYEQQNNSRYQPQTNKDQSSLNRYQLSKNIYQLPTNRYQPPTNRYQHPSSNRQLSYQSQNNYQSNNYTNNNKHTNYSKHHESSHNYSTNTYTSTANYNNQSSVSYEPSNSYVSAYKFQKTDYNQDFTSVQVLSQLRPENRQNIIQIKQYFKGLRRGGQIPQGFDLSKSIIRAASNFQSRSHAKSQLLYDQRPFSTNITSNNNNMYSTSYSSQSYSSFYN